MNLPFPSHTARPITACGGSHEAGYGQLFMSPAVAARSLRFPKGAQG